MFGQLKLCTDMNRNLHSATMVEGIQQCNVCVFNITQTFENTTDIAADCVYLYPTNSKICTYGFKFTIGDKEIVPEMKRKEEATRIFKMAVLNHRMAILSKNKSNSVSSLKLGNLPPHQKCVVEQKCVVMATMTSEGFMFKFPLIAKDQLGMMTTSIPKNFTFSLTLNAPSPITSVVAADCNVKLDRNSAVITASNLPQNKNAIIIDAKVASCNQIAALKAGPFTSISLFPTFNGDVTTSNEYVFIIDCSGSMAGPRIQAAKYCLNTLIHSLPIGCQMSIIRFGRAYEYVLPTCEYNDENLSCAVEKIKAIDSNMGGTNLYQPLHSVLQSPLKPGLTRQIFVITDGETIDSDKCIAECSAASKQNRIFTVGINDADPGIIEGLAEAARGAYVYVDVKDIEEKLVSLLESALTAQAVNTEVFLNGGDVDQTFPRELPFLYSLSPASIITKSVACSSDKNVIVTANLLGASIELTCEAMVDNEMEGALKALFAYYSIKELQNLDIVNHSEALVESIIELSIVSGVQSKFTAYIGTEKVEICGHHNHWLNDGRTPRKSLGAGSARIGYVPTPCRWTNSFNVIANQRADGSWNSTDETSKELIAKYGELAAATIEAIVLITKESRGKTKKYRLVFQKALKFLKIVDPSIDWEAIIQSMI